MAEILTLGSEIAEDIPPVTIPVSSIRRGSCKKAYNQHAKEYRGRRFGQGGFATIYELCDEKKHCPYVLKAQSIFLAPKNNEEFVGLLALGQWTPTILAFQREVALHTIAAEAGLAPPIHDAWICTPKKKKSTRQGIGFIVMDRMDGDLLAYLATHDDIPKNTKKQYIKSIKGLLNQLHDLDIVHDDLSLNNILYKTETDPQGKPSIRFYLNDFGFARFTKDPLPRGSEIRFLRNDKDDFLRLKSMILNPTTLATGGHTSTPLRSRSSDEP